MVVNYLSCPFLGFNIVIGSLQIDWISKSVKTCFFLVVSFRFRLGKAIYTIAPSS